ncbi:MAG: nucleoside hydrolase, partial [Candidatus Acidiferrales bacterium]
MRLKNILPLVAIVAFALATPAQTKRKVIIDQDARGAATTDQQSILMFLQSPNVQTLGITVVSGDMWRDEEIAHTLRMLEITGHKDIPVYPGAVYPLINRMEMIERWEKLYGTVHYQGAWNGHRPGMNLGDGLRGRYHLPFVVPDIPEGNPTIKAQSEDAAHFIIRMVHKYPHEVTIYAGGPMTDIAQAISLDPEVPDLAQEVVVMGGSIAPVVPHDWIAENRREFNFWWDPEAVHIVLTSPWHKITITTVDISVKTRMTKELIAEIAKSKSPASQYLAQYADEEYMWDELAVAGWLDPSVITQQTQYYMDIDISHTAGYGNVLVWTSDAQPGLGEQLVNIPEELNKEKFYKMFIDLMALPPASAHAAAAATPGA